MVLISRSPSQAIEPKCRRWHDHGADYSSMRSGPCRPGVVYVAAMLGRYKIGFTSKPLHERMAAVYQASGAISVVTVAAFAVPCGLGAETYLHDLFEDRRYLGELFDLTEADLGSLETFAEFDGQPVVRMLLEPLPETLPGSRQRQRYP